MAYNGWCGYGLKGWGSCDKVSCWFIWKYAQRMLDFRGVPFPVIAWPISGPSSSIFTYSKQSNMERKEWLYFHKTSITDIDFSCAL